LGLLLFRLTTIAIAHLLAATHLLSIIASSSTDFTTSASSSPFTSASSQLLHYSLQIVIEYSTAASFVTSEPIMQGCLQQPFTIVVVTITDSAAKVIKALKHLPFSLSIVKQVRDFAKRQSVMAS
jgi:hypothetical protein